LAKNRSIRFTLTWQLTLVLLIVMTLFSGFVINRFQGVLYLDTDNLLRAKTQGLEDSINVYWLFYKRTVETEQNFTQAAKDWINSSSNSNLLVGLIVRVYKADGTLIATNRKDLEEVRMSKEFLTQLQKERTIVQNTTIQNFVGFDVWVESLMSYVSTRRQDYIIQTALENRKIEEPLSALTAVIWILLPLFLVAGALLEFGLIKRSLRGVGRFMEGLRNTAGTLREPFDPNEFRETETRDLSLAFNALMTRIEVNFEQQRRVFEDLSHQMKTPLAVMRGELEVSLKKSRSTQDYQDILASSLEEVERMASIVENLLKLARFDAQEMHFEPTRFPLHDCLETLLKQVEKLADSRHVVLDLWCPRDLELTADRFKLEQALLNLLDNAIKYALPRTHVTLGGHREPNGIVLRVHDRGSVIPAEELPQVFDRFWRSRSTMREKGYGLGLSIVKALIQMHSGTVNVTSTEQAGTEFVIRLPQETEPEPPANR